MSHHSQSSSDFESPKSFKRIVKEVEALKLWKHDEILQKQKEKLEKEVQIMALEQEIQKIKQREEKLLKRLNKNKSPKGSSRSSTKSSNDSQSQDNDGSIQMDAYYQPPPRRVIKEHKVRESRVDLPYFHGKENVDAYLDWEMKVEQIFTCHQVGKAQSSSYVKKDYKREGQYDSSKKFGKGLEKEKEKEKEKNKKIVTSSGKTSDIKCFKCLGRGHIASQCPTKKVMILRWQDVYSRVDESSSTTSSDSRKTESCGRPQF
uniref:CCHC-type domain-containing protein n=1 Tax=Cajanus cajan TaxID=3821 RepID=A0A151QMW7_CAJCA|nr:hypothetical protein KK1_047958 [Cajanus cajan]